MCPSAFMFWWAKLSHLVVAGNYNVINVIILLWVFGLFDMFWFHLRAHLFHSIPDPPEVMVGLAEEDKELNFSHITNEGEVPLLFFCFYVGHPFPNATWTVASGESLSSSIRQTHAKPGILLLNFSSGLAYSDPVRYVCTARNMLGTTRARLELIVRGKAEFR